MAPIPMITRTDIERSTFRYAAHYNMGFVKDPDQKVDRHKGYGYGYRCVEYPRLGFIDHFYTLDDGGTSRTWSVDGADSASLEAAIEALNVPPVLTEDEQRILDFIPADFVDLRDLEDELAGVPRPKGAIMPDTPHARVFKWLRALQDKGMVEHGRDPWPAGYKPEMGIDHLRWSPTIRRR